MTLRSRRRRSPDHREQPPRHRPEGRRTAGQRGAGTVLVTAVILVLAVVAAALLVIAGYVAAVHRARAAADLVALSGAAAQAGAGDACRAATAIAARNDVRLVGCRVRGDSLDFVVSVTVEQAVATRTALLPRGVTATAHAGRLGLLP